MAWAYRLTGFSVGTVETQTFRRVAVLFTIYVHRIGRATGRKARSDDQLNTRFCARIFLEGGGGFAYRSFAKPNRDANACEKGMTVDANSLIISPDTIEQERRHVDCQQRHTYLKESYNIDCRGVDVM